MLVNKGLDFHVSSFVSESTDMVELFCKIAKGSATIEHIYIILNTKGMG